MSIAVYQSQCYGWLDGWLWMRCWLQLGVAASCGVGKLARKQRAATARSFNRKVT